MKRFTLMAIAASIVVTITAGAADNITKDSTRRDRAERRETKTDIDKLVREINAFDNSPNAMVAGMAAVSKETAVPLPTIEAEHKQHPKIGLAGLFVAHELSTHTQKPVDQIIKQHGSGKTWTDLATANNQDLNAIEAKLARIQAAIKNPNAAAVK